MKAYLTRDRHRLYKLIWERFVASQMAPAVLDTVALDVTQNDIKFRANGQTIKFKGFMTLYVEAKDDKDNDKENKLPKLNQGDKVTATQIEPAQHFTQPPPRYTEARLVKTLEELKLVDLQHMLQRLTQFKNVIMLNLKVNVLYQLN